MTMDGAPNPYGLHRAAFEAERSEKVEALVAAEHKQREKKRRREARARPGGAGAQGR